MIRPLLPLFALPVLMLPVLAADDAVQPVTIKTPPGQMRYDLNKFDVSPGTKVHLVLENGDEMPHNLVIIKPCGDKGLDLAQKAWALGEKGAEKNWVPEDPRVLFSGKMAEPHGKMELNFTAPTELGDYPYVCTFPGHAMSMNGVMRVSHGGPKVKNLSYKLFLGSWSNLPDFSKLTPQKTGSIEDGVIGWKFDDYKNQFGIQFDGKITASKKGKYKFFLCSDDGAEIIIDGKSLMNRDGIHPAGEPQTKDVELEEGEHDLHLDYFQQAGEAELYVAWQGPGFSETALSKWIPESRKDPASRLVDKNQGIPLGPQNGEAVVYRNFIEGSSPRGITVGYPGGLNLCFDADQMTLAMLWRGAFMDAKRHWTDRGAGNQPPLGYAVLHPTTLAAGIAVLADPNTSPWPAKTSRASELHFKGYDLDAKRIPTFHYALDAMAVTDRFDPEGTDADPKAKFVRTLTVSGTAPASTYARLATGDLNPVEGGYKVGNDLFISVSGAAPLARQKELLVPLNVGQIKVTYQWVQ